MGRISLIIFNSNGQAFLFEVETLNPGILL